MTPTNISQQYRSSNEKIFEIPLDPNQPKESNFEKKKLQSDSNGSVYNLKSVSKSFPTLEDEMSIDSLDENISYIGTECLLIPPSLTRWNSSDTIADFSERSKFRSQIELINHDKTLSINEMRCRLLNDTISEKNCPFFGTKSSKSLLVVDEFESDLLHQIFSSPLSHDSGTFINESIYNKSNEMDCSQWDHVKDMTKTCAYTESKVWKEPINSSFNLKPMQSNMSILNESDEFGFNALFNFPNNNYHDRSRANVETCSKKSSFPTSGPYNMKTPSDLEVSRLIDAHDEAAFSLHHNATTGVSDCNTNRGRRWTSNEDRLLLYAISVRGRSPYNWKEISSTAFFGSRNPYQCMVRWRNYLDPKIKHEPFTKEEDALIITSRNGNQPWYVIAAKLNGRSVDQIRNRYINDINPKREKNKPWTASEDEIISRIHQELGNRWTIIAKSLPGRSPRDVKNRYNNKKHADERKKRADSG